MDTYSDKKYISLIAPRIDKFHWKSPNLGLGRCPFCGDSKKNPNKTRFYFYVQAGRWKTKCHNCSYANNFGTFLKQFDASLHKEYILEHIGFRRNDDQVVSDSEFMVAADIRYDTPEAYEAFIKLKRISSLKPEHPAWKYVHSRLIPNEYHAVLRWCPNFMYWTNQLVPGKFSPGAQKAHDEGRVIIPFVNKFRRLFAYTGRSLSNNAEVRYITIVLNGQENMLWGLDRYDPKKRAWVVEGPIDAMFVPNTIALGGSGISALTKVADCDRLRVAYDNEPRSKETKAKILSAIDNGYPVVIWPDGLEPKDINQMVLAGYSPSHIESVMERHTYEGIGARMRLDAWSKR